MKSLSSRKEKKEVEEQIFHMDFCDFAHISITILWVEQKGCKNVKRKKIAYMETEKNFDSFRNSSAIKLKHIF